MEKKEAKNEEDMEAPFGEQEDREEPEDSNSESESRVEEGEMVPVELNRVPFAERIVSFDLRMPFHRTDLGYGENEDIDTAFSEERAWVMFNDLAGAECIGVINMMGELIYSASYESLLEGDFYDTGWLGTTPFENGTAALYSSSQGWMSPGFIIIDRDGNELFTSDDGDDATTWTLMGYGDGVYLVEKKTQSFADTIDEAFLMSPDGNMLTDSIILENISNYTLLSYIGNGIYSGEFCTYDRNANELRRGVYNAAEPDDRANVSMAPNYGEKVKLLNKPFFSGEYAELYYQGSDDNTYVTVMDRNGNAQYEPVRIDKLPQANMYSYTYDPKFGYAWNGYVLARIDGEEKIITPSGEILSTGTNEISGILEESSRLSSSYSAIEGIFWKPVWTEPFSYTAVDGSYSIEQADVTANTKEHGVY